MRWPERSRQTLVKRFHERSKDALPRKSLVRASLEVRRHILAEVGLDSSR
jgi:hypothetical protein